VTGFELLLLILLIAAVAFSLAGAAVRDIRWMSAAVGCLALMFLCQLVNSI
jgi:hypothetical protein